jgi:hypothetical protein
VVRAIDGQPATEFHQESLGNADITHLTEYPLAVMADEGRGYYLRAPGRTDEAGGKPALALCISCAGRRQILGSRTKEEGRIVNERLGDVPAAGFYGYGEIARLAKDGISHYHNETFTTVLLGGRVGSA